MHESVRSQAGPLTFGQLSVLRALQRLPMDHWSGTYLSELVAVPPGVGAGDVTAALAVLAERHESLRTRFSSADAGIAVVHERAGHELDVETVDVDDKDGDTARAVGRQRSMRRFDWDNEFAWRATIVSHAGSPAHVVLTVDHIVADGSGLRRLASELAALLGAENARGRIWLTQDSPRPSELAALQRSTDWDKRRSGADRHWNNLLRRIPSDAFPAPAPTDKNGRIEMILRSPGARAALARAAALFAVTPQNLMLTMSAVAAATVHGQDEAVMSLQSGNRFDERWRDIVSSMNQSVPLPIRVGADGISFTDLTAHAQLAALKAYRNGMYDIDHIAAKVAGDRDGAQLHFDSFFNFMAHDITPDPVADAGAAPEGQRIRTRPARQAGPRFDVKIWPGTDMPVVIRTDPALLDERGLDALLGWVDTEVGRLGQGEDSSVGEMRKRLTTVLH